MIRNNILRVGRRNITVSTEQLLPKKYGGRYTVTLIPGDGIGKEVTDSVVSIIEAENAPIDWECIEISGLDNHGEGVQRAVDSLKKNKVGLKGIWSTPADQTGHGSLNVAFRKQLDIFANVALFKSFPGVKTKIQDVDLVIIRENTEGEYSGLEHESVPGVVESLKIMTKAKSERIARFAFDFALKNNRKSVCAVHKANIMKLGDGLFRNIVNEVGKNEYPEIEVKNIIVDNASMQAVAKPHQFDVLVTPNLYGSILGNIGAALIGGPGLVPGANFGREYAVFEPGCRHVGLDIKGQDVANPTAMILSSTLMLRHLGLNNFADRISHATYSVIAEGKHTTRDIGGSSSTTEFTNAIIKKLATL
ncbi:HDL211Cp [Eremothecium sinecaudum]|uniref:Isocitrate dehydrogenase [NAD] subunit 1, mitochondrial n=1 Tax=Eremothecium sinecaudum TaxID=45286 RepID=A0A109UZ47_9SACH|nr:HDL211Cp [Eremothecium sinecaudum]AMD20533.1 HDL211Cp [Eremothecium sinecaudum]